MISNKLNELFSAKELSKLTFICAPASTMVKNEKRFKSFAECVCSNTGMENGYGSVTVKQDREASHNSKQSSNPIEYLNFKSNYFTNRKIIIFDDVVTRGRTMCLLSQKLESLGAETICVISIGRTTHK
jgi:predicted amidophosphoribosyltransferase